MNNKNGGPILRSNASVNGCIGLEAWMSADEWSFNRCWIWNWWKCSSWLEN